MLPHQVAQPRLEQVRGLAVAGPVAERRRDPPRERLQRGPAHAGQRPADHAVGHGVAGDAAEDGGLGHAIAAEPVGAVHAARILARRE